MIDMPTYRALLDRFMALEAKMYDMVPRSRIAAIETEKAQVEQTLKDVQKYGHAEITRLEEELKQVRKNGRIEITNLLAQIEVMRIALERASPWADLQLRIPDKNCLLEGSRGPRCRYCGEWYASADSDDGHARNCNRPTKGKS